MPRRPLSDTPVVARARCLALLAIPVLALATGLAGCGSDEGHGGGAEAGAAGDAGATDAAKTGEAGADATASEAGAAPEAGSDAGSDAAGSDGAGTDASSADTGGGHDAAGGGDASSGDDGAAADAAVLDATADGATHDASEAGTDGGSTTDGGTVGPACIADAGAGGVCVQQLATAPSGEPLAMAVHGGSVFWITSTSVERVPVTGGTPSTVATTGGTDLAVDDTNVYFAQGTGVYTVPVGGGTPTPLIDGQIALSHLAIDATSVYFTSSTSIGKIGKNGTGYTVLAGSPAIAATTEAIAVNASAVFFTVCPGDECDVDRCALDGSGLATLAPKQFEPFALTLDATGVYWIDNTAPGGITKLPFGATQLVPVASAANPSALASDGTTLYFESGGAIQRMPVGGAVVSPLATGQPSPRLLAIDATAAYWFDFFIDAQNDEVFPLMKASPR